jgi:protein involved in polysaccharide export with SLBB domain
MRFLQGRSFADVGHVLGISEEAARKRVERSIEKLRSSLLKMGVMPSIDGLTMTLAAHRAIAAPALFSPQSITAFSVDSTEISASIAKEVIKAMNVANTKLFALIILIPAVIVTCGILKSVINFTAATRPISQPTPAIKTAKTEVNDRLQVSLTNLIGMRLTQTLRTRVDPSGRISLPLIGQVSVAGKTLAEVQDVIAKAYSDAQIIKPSDVRVDFSEQGDNVSIHSSPFQIGDHLLLHVGDLNGIGEETIAPDVVDSKGCTDTPQIFNNGASNPPELTNVKIQGLTEYQTEQKIVAAYRSAQVLANAGVSVERISAKEAAAYNAKL